MKNKNFVNKVKCFNPIYNKNCKVLILGNAPGNSSIKKGFYYLDGRNYFWELIDYVTNEKGFFNSKRQEYNRIYEDKKISSREKNKLLNEIKQDIERKLFKHKIAIFDVIKECKRKNSSDNSIVHKSIKINKLDEMCKSVKHIFINGKSYKQGSPYRNFKQNYYKYLKKTTILNSSSCSNRNNKSTIKRDWKKISSYI